MLPIDLQEKIILFGFLEKRHKSTTMEIYQKRWCFLISARPLIDKHYETDNFQVEDSILPSGLLFDNIYYFKFDNDNDITEAKGRIALSYTSNNLGNVMEWK